MTALEAVAMGRDLVAAGPSLRDSVGAWPGQEHGLTSREAEILGLIVAGLSNVEIAQRLYLSVNTVKTYVRTAYRKADVTSRSQAVLWGVEHGLHSSR